MIEKKILEKYYLQDKLSTIQIAKKTGYGKTTIHKWLVKYDIPRRSISEATKLNPPYSGRFGKENSNWKGDNISINGIHKYIKRYKLKPRKCERCGKETNLELSCNGHIYTRNLDDYEYLCRKCHDIKDKSDKL